MPHNNPINWNDAPGRTFAEVKELVEPLKNLWAGIMNGPLRYQPGFRPRCAVCNAELLPAVNVKGDAHGFMPCPLHPRSDVLYPEIPQEVGVERHVFPAPGDHQ